MMGSKTFPVQMNGDFHKEVKRFCFDNDVTIKLFILDAIKEKLNKEKLKIKSVC